MQKVSHLERQLVLPVEIASRPERQTTKSWSRRTKSECVLTRFTRVTPRRFPPQRSLGHLKTPKSISLKMFIDVNSFIFSNLCARDKADLGKTGKSG